MAGRDPPIPCTLDKRSTTWPSGKASILTAADLGSIPALSVIFFPVELYHKFDLMWTHWLQITQLSGQSCTEETTATLVYCDSFLPITEEILGSTREKEIRCDYETLTVKK